MLGKGQRVVAIGGSDAHALHLSMGPLHRIVFPYEYHFSTINTHTFTPTSLTGELAIDRKMVFDALGSGHCFIGYDLPAPTRGFRFSAHGESTKAIMGDEIDMGHSVTMQAKLPSIAEIRLVKDGKCVKKVNGETLTFVIDQPGAYRIEAYKRYLGKSRGWIFSNPIYVK